MIRPVGTEQELEAAAAAYRIPPEWLRYIREHVLPAFEEPSREQVARVAALMGLDVAPEANEDGGAR